MKLLRIIIVGYLLAAAIYSRGNIFIDLFVALVVLSLLELATLLREKRKLPLLCVGVFAVGLALLRWLPNDVGSRGIAFVILIVLWLPAGTAYLWICLRDVLPGHSKKAPNQPPEPMPLKRHGSS